MVIIVFGLPGSGKSFFASELAKMINADYVNSDKVRKELFKKRDYSDQEKGMVYYAMLEQMKEAVKQKRNIVLDATFHKKAIREMFVEAMKGISEIKFIEVCADENLIRERLKKPRQYSEADFEVYQIIKKQNEPLGEPHLILQSTDENIDYMLKRVSEYLQLKDE